MQGIDTYANMLDRVAAIHRSCTDYGALTPLVQAEATERICGGTEHVDGPSS